MSRNLTKYPLTNSTNNQKDHFLHEILIGMILNNFHAVLLHDGMNLIPKSIYFLYRLISICIVIDKKCTYQQSC